MTSANIEPFTLTALQERRRQHRAAINALSNIRNHFSLPGIRTCAIFNHLTVLSGVVLLCFRNISHQTSFEILPGLMTH